MVYLDSEDLWYREDTVITRYQSMGVMLFKY
jgi:hypothetical protein